MPRSKGTRKPLSSSQRSKRRPAAGCTPMAVIEPEVSSNPLAAETTATKAVNRKRVPKELIEQTRQLMERTIDFVLHPLFEKDEAEALVLELRPDTLNAPAEIGHADPGIVFVTGLAKAPLLTRDEEIYWFVWMNYLKFRAEQNRRRLDLTRPDKKLINAIEEDLRLASDARNHIVEGNLRLVVSQAKKLSMSMEQMAEMISEGMMPLIRSVELFDISLGNRFSTYATWAVRNQMVRWLKRSRSGLEVTRIEDSPSMENLADPHAFVEEPEGTLQMKTNQVLRLLDRLNDRERQIVRARFALEGEPTGQSLADIAKRLGLCKERVRQIACHSLAKLRDAITEENALVQ